MIKELIADVAYDRIKLSQGLTRAKLIANKLKNVTFMQWLSKELEGYEYQDEMLPEYRKVWSPIQLIAQLPYGQTHKFQVTPPEELDADFQDAINRHRIVEPISIVEMQVQNIEDTSGVINLPNQLVASIAGPYQQKVKAYRGVITKGYREVAKVHYQSVLELTKQKLIDTLMELDNEFPNLINEYTMTEENNDKVQNIITNHIYGDNNAANIAAGQHVTQNVTQQFTISDKDEEQLRALGVQEDQLEELKAIVASKAKDKPSFVGKAMKWLGGVTASIASRGLYDNIPMLTDFVHKLTS